MENNRNSLANYTVLFAVLISYMTILSKAIFDVLSGVILYLFAALILFLVCICTNIKVNRLMFVIITGIVVVLAITINDGGIGSVITFILPFLVLFVFERVELTQNSKKIIRVLSLLIFLFICVRSVSYASNWQYHRLNDINPNTMGQFMLFALIYMSALDNKKGIKKYLFLSVIFIIAAINYETRAILLCLGLYVLGLLFINKLTLKQIKILFLVLLGISIAFPFFYLQLYENNVNFTIFSKPLYTGREQIWSEMMNQIEQEPSAWIWGLGSDVVLQKDLALNLHNNPFAIIVDFGLLGFALFYGCVISLVMKIKAENVTVKKLLLGWICSVILLGFTEVTTMWANSLFLSFLTLGLARFENRNMIDVNSKKNFYKVRREK